MKTARGKSFNIEDFKFGSRELRMKRVTMYLLLVVLSLLFVAGCSAYSDMNGTVIDGESGKPIEGAVVLVEWTKTKGIGLTHTESFKVQEVITDKDGKFVVSGVSDPFVNAPDLTIYKQGYVCWNNKYIFPDSSVRSDFKWMSGVVIKLDHFLEQKYSHSDHVMYIRNSIHSGSPKGEKRLMESAIRREELMSVKETSHSK